MLSGEAVSRAGVGLGEPPVKIGVGKVDGEGEAGEKLLAFLLGFPVVAGGGEVPARLEGAAVVLALPSACITSPALGHASDRAAV